MCFPIQQLGAVARSAAFFTRLKLPRALLLFLDPPSALVSKRWASRTDTHSADAVVVVVVVSVCVVVTPPHPSPSPQTEQRATVQAAAFVVPQGRPRRARGQREMGSAQILGRSRSHVTKCSLPFRFSQHPPRKASRPRDHPRSVLLYDQSNFVLPPFER